jgi:hypothetical protein
LTGEDDAAAGFGFSEGDGLEERGGREGGREVLRDKVLI